jgi:hypothetical protein
VWLLQAWNSFDWCSVLTYVTTRQQAILPTAGGTHHPTTLPGLKFDNDLCNATVFTLSHTPVKLSVHALLQWRRAWKSVVDDWAVFFHLVLVWGMIGLQAVATLCVLLMVARLRRQWLLQTRRILQEARWAIVIDARLPIQTMVQW